MDSQQSFPQYIQGFVHKRSITTNALLHHNKKYILNADIKSFFESITRKQVADVFMKIGCISDVAEIIADFCTLEGFLFQGASSSPVIANFVCLEMDNEFDSLAKHHKLTYSRYADDLTFSGEKISDIKSDIEAILSKYGFSLNEKKFQISKRGQPQYVTGLNIADKKYPRVPKKFKRKLRLELFYADKYGIYEHIKRIFLKKYRSIDSITIDETNPMVQFEMDRIAGWVSYISSVEIDLGKKIKEQWNKIQKTSGFADRKTFPKRPAR